MSIKDFSAKLGKFKKKILSPFNPVMRGWESFLAKLPTWLSPWVSDIADVLVTVGIIIIILKAVFGAHMLVPLVVVTSESMVHKTHDNSWSIWMKTRGLTDEQISSFPMNNGFNMGDMILVRDPSPVLGDVIIYERDLDHLNFPSTDPIIHRVVGVVHIKDYKVSEIEGTTDCLAKSDMSKYIGFVKSCQQKNSDCVYPLYPEGGEFRLFITKGDNNPASDQCNPQIQISHPVNDAQVTAKTLLRLPYIGWLKIFMSFIFRLLTLQL